MTTWRSFVRAHVVCGVALALCACGRDGEESSAEAVAEHEGPALGVALDEDEMKKLGVEVAGIAAAE